MKKINFNRISDALYGKTRSIRQKWNEFAERNESPEVREYCQWRRDQAEAKRLAGKGLKDIEYLIDSAEARGHKAYTWNSEGRLDPVFRDLHPLAIKKMASYLVQQGKFVTYGDNYLTIEFSGRPSDDDVENVMNLNWDSHFIAKSAIEGDLTIANLQLSKVEEHFRPYVAERAANLIAKAGRTVQIHRKYCAKFMTIDASLELLD